MHRPAGVGVQIGGGVVHAAPPAAERKHGATLRKRAVAALPVEHVVGHDGGVVVVLHAGADVEHGDREDQLLGGDQIHRRLALGEVRGSVDMGAGVLIERPGVHEEAVLLTAELLRHPHRVIDREQREVLVAQCPERLARRHLTQPAAEVPRPPVERATQLGQSPATALAQRVAAMATDVLERT